MRRREFFGLLGGAAAWPVAAQAQPRVPVIGSLHAASQKGFERHMDAFRQGLSEETYIEGQNVFVEYRWAHGAFEQLPAMMADLVRKGVAVITAWGTAARTVQNAHAAGIGNDIPVVFAFAGDPVAIGLVASFNHPGGNVTGVTSIGVELGSKRLTLLREIAPKVRTIISLRCTGAHCAMMC
jgi:putative tryptophan/tyrosine transport system substrate-binding protein